MWQTVTATPAAALRPFVARYEGYVMRGQPPGTHRGLPSPYLTMIVAIDEPLVVSMNGGRPEPFDVLLGGLHTTPATITHDGRQAGIQLALHPLGARALLGLPAGELAGIDVQGHDLFGAAARELHERVNTATDWPGRFAALDAVLLSRVQDAAPPVQVQQAWSQLVTPGPTPVSRLAREVGWSERHLSGRLRLETGLSPRGIARLVRFDRARRTLQERHLAGRPTSLGRLAADTGYSDQAHLTRDFSALAGLPPRAWLAAEFRNVQDSAAR